MKSIKFPIPATIYWHFLLRKRKPTPEEFSWDKVSRIFGAEPVLEEKSYEYHDDMLQTAFLLAASGSMPVLKPKDRSGVTAPRQKLNQYEIIEERVWLSRFKKT